MNDTTLISADGPDLHHPYAVTVTTSAQATDFAVVDGVTRHWFHGHIPVAPTAVDEVWVDYSWDSRESVIDRCGVDGDPTLAIFWMLNQWLNATSGRSPARQPPLLVFLTPDADDLDWFTDAFRRAGLPERFVRDTTNHHPVAPIPDALAYVHDRKHAGRTS